MTKFVFFMILFCFGNCRAFASEIYILKSSGVCDGCAEAVSKMLFTRGMRSQILGPEQIKSSLKSDDLLVIGGGNPADPDGELTIKRDLEKADAFDWLRRFIAKGGRYVGICAGAYLTEKWIDPSSRDAGLDIFPGRIDNYSRNKTAQLLPIESYGKRITRWVYFQDGPLLEPTPGAKVKVLARFREDRKPAALIFPWGRGHVGLLSPHPEADTNWSTEAGLKDPDGLDYELGIQLIENVLSAGR